MTLQQKTKSGPPGWKFRNMVNDIKSTLPSGVQGPFFNDRFDDVSVVYMP